MFAYEQSLFQRIQKINPEAVQLLSVQYRMHPHISTFPNKFFYADKLTDGPYLSIRNSRPWHQRGVGLGVYKFYDIPGQERNQVRRSGDQGTSKSNEMEAISAVSIVANICASCPEINVHWRISVVCVYSLGSLRERLELSRHTRNREGPSRMSCVGGLELRSCHPLKSALL